MKYIIALFLALPFIGISQEVTIPAQILSITVPAQKVTVPAVTNPVTRAEFTAALARVDSIVRALKITQKLTIRQIGDSLFIYIDDSKGPGWKVTSVVSPPAKQGYALFSPQTAPPSSADANINEGAALTTGVRFTITGSAQFQGIRFYKGNTQSLTYKLSLYTPTERPVTTTITTAESGWITVPMNPITLSAGTQYVAAVYASSGLYASTDYGYNASKVNGPITATLGVYAMSDILPTMSYRNSDYWITPIVLQ